MLSVCLITKNEEQNILACLESVVWADEIIVLDSGSSDATLEIARRFTPKVFSQPFSHFAEQKNRAMSRASGDWIFFIDADERVPKELAEEIRRTAEDKTAPCVYEVKRETYFLGRRLRFSGTQDDAPIRLFPKNKVRYEQPVHEKIVTDLPVRRLRHSLAHLTTRTLAHYREKLEQYTTLEVRAMREQGKKINAAHLLAGPPAKFIYLYLGQWGILDGIAGLQFAVLSAYYYFVKCKKFLRS